MAMNISEMEKIDRLWINANLATMTPIGPYGVVRNGALAVSGQKIAWVGELEDLSSEIKEKANVVTDAGGNWITPGLIDCHTHIVWGGSRAGEFELRLNGATYEEIARQGGGIRSTVASTRSADEDVLYRDAAIRLNSLMSEGVTTVEIKSGYGLNLDAELKMLRVARKLGVNLPITVCPTFLGAHALPPEFEGRSDDYIDFLCETVLPVVVKEKLATAVDVFCDNIGFTPDQTEKVFQAAKAHGLPVKLHAEQLSDQGGAALAAGYNALSADHLEYLSEDGVKSMAGAGTVAVLLPGAFYCLRETKLPPIEAMRNAGLRIAISTDCNPGTSPVGSILLTMNMACTLFRLTPEEALAGATVNAAAALGLRESKGTLEPGKDADLVVWDILEPAQLAYGIGFNPAVEVVRLGETVKKRTLSPM